MRALRAAWAASEKFGSGSDLVAPFDGGGGGGVDRAGETGGLGAEEGGTGGADGGAARLVVDAEVSPEGFREDGGGIGGFLPIGGGFGFEDTLSIEEAVDTTDDGLRLLRKAATLGMDGADGGCGGAPPGTLGGGGGVDTGAPGGLGGALGGAAPGTLGAEPVGGRGPEVLEVSGSDRYGEELSRPVSMLPPVFLNFGMPPASSPPS